MCKLARIKVLVLALMLGASHVALISHATAHFSPNLEQCELCVSQAQLFGAIPSSDQAFAIDLGYKIAPLEAVGDNRAEKCATAHRQRAPPIPSA